VRHDADERKKCKLCILEAHQRCVWGASPPGCIWGCGGGCCRCRCCAPAATGGTARGAHTAAAGAGQAAIGLPRWAALASRSALGGGSPAGRARLGWPAQEGGRGERKARQAAQHVREQGWAAGPHRHAHVAAGGRQAGGSAGTCSLWCGAGLGLRGGGVVGGKSGGFVWASRGGLWHRQCIAQTRGGGSSGGGGGWGVQSRRVHARARCCGCGRCGGLSTLGSAGGRQGSPSPSRGTADAAGLLQGAAKAVEQLSRRGAWQRAVVHRA
jgi:hypothetical protein